MIDFISHIPFEKLGWTALHFFWISGIFLGIIAGLFRFLKKPFLRYRVVQGALILLLLLPIALWIEKPASDTGTEKSGQEIEQISQLESGAVAGRQENQKNAVPPTDQAEKTAQRSGETGDELFWNQLGIITEIDVSEYYGLLGGFWVSGSLLLLIYFLGGLAVIIRKRRTFRSVENSKWQKICEQLADELEISQRVELLRSDTIGTPCVVGIFRPTVWLPSDLTDRLEEQQMRALLAHELVHIKRNDYLAGLVQQMALVFLFIQPIVWWLVNRLQQEREFICDEESAGIHRDRYHYASTLVWIKKNCSGKFNAALTGINATEHQLVKRIRRLTTLSDDDPNREIKSSLLVSMMFGLALAVFGMGWTSYQLSFEARWNTTEEGQFIVDLEKRIPNPYNGGGIEVLLSWDQLPEEKQDEAVLPELDADTQKTFARSTFTGGADASASDTVYALFVNPASKSPEVYLDANQNLDFTDDGGKKLFSDGALTAEIPNGRAVNAKHLIRWSDMEQSAIDSLRQRPEHWTNDYSYVTLLRKERLNHSTGEWTYRGNSYSITLIDRNLNGIFGEIDSGFLTVNESGQQSLENRSSYFLYELPTLEIGSDQFEVLDIKSDGTKLLLEKVDR